MKKSLSLFLTVAITFSIGTSVFASFPDMKDTKWDWARSAVDEMVSSSLIKGYEDNTFRPDKQITRAEAIVLTSRVAGYTQKNLQEFIDLGVNANIDALKGFSIPYTKESAYLIYKGVLNKDDFDLFFGDSSKPLKRYEAAILLTKLMDGEDWVKKAVAAKDTSTGFNDEDAIPQEAQPYVLYVSKNEIMKGIDEKNFSPMTSVTRAQIAMLLYRVINKLSYTYTLSEVLSTDYKKQTITISVNGNEQEITVSDSMKLYIDGKLSSIENVYPGAKINVLSKANVPALMECISPKLDSVFDGIFTGHERINGQTMLSVRVNDKARTFALSENVTVMYNNKSSTISQLVSGDTIKVEIKDNKVISIKSESRDKPVSGIVTSIVLEPVLKISIRDETENTADYEVDNVVKVRKNGMNSTLSDVLVGDEVKVVITYGKITEVSANSTTKIETGLIDELVISKTPAVVIKFSDGTSKKYEVSRKATISKDSKNATIYDLRLSDTIKVNIESGTVTSFEIQSSPERTTISGTVEYINTSYGYIKLAGNNDLIFTSKAKYLDNTGSSKAPRDIAIGKNLLITGTSTPGGFEANLIIIN